MWSAVNRLMSEYCNEEYRLIEKSELAGGDIHTAHVANNGKLAVFIKSNSREHLPVFVAESEQLALLARSKTVYVPKVYGVGTAKENSFLLLEYLPQKPLDAHNAWLLGKQIAALHKWIEQPQFGLDFDNDLNTTPQPNTWQRRWHLFFSEQRIGWQLQLASEKGMFFGDIDKIVAIIQKKLSHHQPQPSLLHGDLWPANCGLSANGPLLFDPASYWGDRECDLAMLPLYSHLPAQIYDGYQSVWPLPQGFIERQPLYQLYYLLNKCNLFGKEYSGQVQRLVDAIMA